MDPVSARHGWAVGFVLTLNASIGSGILVIPWAFEKAGIVLGCVLASLSTLLVLVLAFQMMEVMSRAEAWVRKTEGKDADETVELQGDRETPRITDRKLDVTEMVRLLYGEKLRTIYTCCYAVFIYIGGMALSSIFSTTLTEFIPLLSDSCDVYSDGLHGGCRLLFTVYLGLYCVLMLYFSWRGYEEQVTMQVITATVRVTVVSIMLVTSVAAVASGSYLEGDKHNPVPAPRLWHPLYSGVVFPIFFLACSFHSAIPNIAQLLVNKPRNLPKALSLAVATCFLLYVAVGCLVPLGVDGVSKLASLEWKDYSAGYEPGQKPWWTYLIQFPVVLFPAFEAISMFPLYAVTLSDNLIALRHGHSYEGQLSPVTSTQSEFALYRSAAVLPPILLTAVVYDIVTPRLRA